MAFLLVKSELTEIRFILGGVVPEKCTLPKNGKYSYYSKSKTLETPTKKYCWSYAGKHKYSAAVNVCDSLQAKLPLPQNLQDQFIFAQFFRQIGSYYNYLHFDMSNPKKSGNVFVLVSPRRL